MNIYEKLIKARAKFLEAGVQKSGKNYGIGYKYFELKDIVPVATKIFEELGMVAITTYNEATADMMIFNTEKPEEFVLFSSPMRYAPVSKGSNEIQSLGSTQTYLRRYLYMTALDIIEDDTVDSGVEITPVTEKTEPQQSVRAEIKKELTATDSPAEQLQKDAITIACQKYLDITNKSKEAKAYVSKIVKDTNNLTSITKAQAEEIIKGLNEKVNAKVEKPMEISPDDLPF